MKLNQLKAGAVLSYLSMGLGYLVSLIYTPIMLRLLGQSEYGLYNLVASIVSYLGVLNFGFGSAYIRYYSKYKVKNDNQKINKLNGMFLIIFSALGIIAVIAGTILAFNVDFLFGAELSNAEIAKAKILMFILVINLAISFPNIVFSSHITANEKFLFQKIIKMVQIVINPFVVIPILVMGYGSIGLVAVTTLLNLAVEIGNIIYCIKILEMKFSFKNFDFVLMREMIIFSSFIFINLVVDQINWNVDKFILGRYQGTISVAVYGLAAQLNSYYVSFATTISSVFVPRVHRLVASAKAKELTLLFTKIGRIQFILLSFLLSGYIFFGRLFINLWAGKDYNESYPILLLLTIPVTIPLIQTIGIEIQRAKNLHKFRSAVYLFISIGNLALSIPLAKLYGGRGAALGTAIALIIGNGFLMNWYNHVKVGLDMIFFWKQIILFVPALILPTVVGIFIKNTINIRNLLQFFSFGMLYSLVFCFSMWFIGMNQYEKELISKPIKNLFRKAHWE